MANMEQGGKPQLLLPNSLEDCQAVLAEARREVEELNDKYLRAAAQVENVRKWTERDTLARVKESQRNLLRRLIEVMDNLDRALSQPAEPAALYQGVELTRRQLEKVLAQVGVEPIQTEVGQPFDPNFHEAVEVRRGSVAQPTVAGIVQPGYIYENELLRPASVIVVN